MSQIVKTGDLIAIMFSPRSYETMRDGRVGVTSATRKSHLLIGCKLHQFVRAADLFDAISSTSLIGIGRDVRSRRGGKMAARHLWGEAPRSSVVARDVVQAGHVLQQDAAALQIEDAVLAPGLQLPGDALACGADEHAELLLRNVDFGAEILGEGA